jgi:hypothetical protein
MSSSGLTASTSRLRRASRRSVLTGCPLNGHDNAR